jgi:hypothetical protein
MSEWVKSMRVEMIGYGGGQNNTEHYHHGCFLEKLLPEGFHLTHDDELKANLA